MNDPLQHTDSFVQVLRYWADKDNSAIDPSEATAENPRIEGSFRYGFAFRFLHGQDAQTLTYPELDEAARRIAAAMLEHGRVKANGMKDRALLIFEPGLEFVQGFMACLYTGITAVPVCPPNAAQKDTVTRFLAIAENAEPSIILTHADIHEALIADYGKTGSLAKAHWIVADHCDVVPPLAVDRLAAPQDNDLALLQYTSGSTRAPRGVMVSHNNLMHNARLIRKGFRHDEVSSSGVIWLPHYHDMGLMGGILQTIYQGMATVLMPPGAFIRRPLLWLKTISEYQGVTSGGPNFAYNHCTRRIPDSALADLDLSGWRVAFCGAEPIHSRTLDAFAERFAVTGFKREAFVPCYGLAESTLAVTMGAYEQGRDVISVRAEALERKLILPAVPETIGSTELVGSGIAQGDLNVAIVGGETKKPLPENAVGEVWVAGESVAAGYWQDTEETESAFGARTSHGDGPYLRTGDLGFLREGRLFVTGRHKDTLLINGRNLYAQDIEACLIEAHPALDQGSVVAVSIPKGETEGLALVIGARSNQIEELKVVVQRTLSSHLAVAATRLIFVPKSEIPKTSSGKLQRALVRQRVLEGRYHEVGSIPDVPSLYLPVTPEFERLENRDIKYRFDIEKDVCWDEIDAGGDFFTDELLAIAGVDRESLTVIDGLEEAFQWALAIAICEEFVVLEQRIVRFLNQEQASGRLPSSRSSALFDTEEVKHIRLFRRMADGLKIRRPARHQNIATVLDAHLIRSFETAWWHNDSVENYPSATIYHYVCWLHFLYFEEYSIYLYNQLRNKPDIQPLWLSAHAAHMREETQHVRTDAGYLDLLDLDEDSREQWGRWFMEQSARDAGGLAGLEGVWTFLVERYPRVSELPVPIALIDNMNLRQAAFLRLLNHKNAFLRTKRGARFERYEENLFKIQGIGGEIATKNDPSGKDGATPGVNNDTARMQNLIVSAIAEQLKMDAERVDVNQHLMLFGLDSVSAVSISVELERILQTKLPPNLLFEHETIAKLAKALADMDVKSSGESEQAAGNELEFDATIFAEPQGEKGKHIFLTGATGFLCAFVLAEKLKTSRDHVTCLVRAKTPEDGLQRIKNNLQGYGIWQDNFAKQISVVSGDLEKKLFGLNESEFRTLAEDIDQIIHGAALVDFIKPYAQLKAANVVGTQEILRLAFMAGKVPLDLVSTIGIFDTNNQRGMEMVTEADIPDSNYGFRNGYAESKWAAERLVRIAMERGLPVRIYRPGIVSGSTQNGAWQPDMVAALLKTYVEYKVAIQPRADGNLNAAPVDYVAQAIVNISQQADTFGKVFHLTNPNSTLWSEIIEYLAQLGYSTRTLSYKQWLERLTRATESDAAILPYLAYFKTRGEQWQLRQPPFSCTNTENALKSTGISCSRIDKPLLEIYLDYFKRNGFISEDTMGGESMNYP
uniref:Thioester reductase domain-containing protein n=1 Tax=Candidatus Kentrum sp. LPFa TaxID=2126335 RepID=A0A450W007_9GAMM|nr:MAG: thioester reductase domain-containing protein [Candidatus Kentron sp. LPFa]VFK26362.1 MAG: thioester reductase domain-containing protein [Candidatus Kentron sp. LPFa]